MTIMQLRIDRLAGVARLRRQLACRQITINERNEITYFDVPIQVLRTQSSHLVTTSSEALSARDEAAKQNRLCQG
jgi:hypothetical protein